MFRVALRGFVTFTLLASRTVLAQVEVEVDAEGRIQDPSVETIKVTTKVTQPVSLPQPVAVSVSAEEARHVPGTQGDTAKVVENLPGVARAGLGSGDLILWGAAPWESRVLVDGIEVPALFHIGGLRTVVASPLLASVEVVPGAYGAPYGRGLGGLVRVGTASLPIGIHGGASLDPLDTTLHLGASRGSRLRIAGAWREGLLHRILVGDDATEAGRLLAVPAIRDQQLKASTIVSDDEEVHALLLTSRDRLQRGASSVDPAQTRTEVIQRDFFRAGPRYVRLPGEREPAEAVVWFGSDSSRRDLAFGPVPARLNTAATSFGLRAFVRERVTRSSAVTLGLDGLIVRSHLERTGSVTVPAREGDPYVFGQPPGDDVNSDDWHGTSVAAAPFASAELAVRNFTASLGLRLEAMGLEVSRATPRVGATPAIGSRRLDWAADPRVALGYRPRSWLRLQASGGRYHQLPAVEDLSAVFGTAELGPARADHAAVGVAFEGAPFTVEITGFAKRLAELAARDPAATPPLAHMLTNQGCGRSDGVQFLVRCLGSEGFSGWLAYTLAHSQRQDDPRSAFRPADFDQTHTFAGVATYQRGPWTLGSRLRFASGARRTPVTGVLYDSRADRHAPLFGATNSIRLPSFLQLDFHFERSLAVARSLLDLYIEVLNATARRNAEEFVYNFDYSARQTITGLPFLAFAGARLRF